MSKIDWANIFRRRDRQDVSSQDKQITERIKQELINEVIAFLNKRAQQLYDLGGVHIRESVSLAEAAIMIENGMWGE